MDCTICCSQIVEACVRTPCGHVFHDGCVRPWLRQRRQCPNCRAPAVELDLEYGEAPSAPPIDSELAARLGRREAIDRIAAEARVGPLRRDVYEHCCMVFDAFDSRDVSPATAATAVVRGELEWIRRSEAELCSVREQLLRARAELRAAQHRADKYARKYHRLRRAAEPWVAAPVAAQLTPPEPPSGVWSALWSAFRKNQNTVVPF